MSSLPMIPIVPIAAPSAPTRVEGKGSPSEPDRDTIPIPDPTQADTLTEPGTRSRLVVLRKRISPLSASGFLLGFLVGMAIVAAIARYWLGLTHF